MSWQALGSVSPYAPTALAMRCAVCGHDGVFVGVQQCNDAVFNGGAAAIRICPNPTCRAIALCIHDGSEVLEQFPPPAIDFDSSGLPEPILASLREAISCHSVGAFRAAALMVRRVLEELCLDRGATGKDLKARLQALGSGVVLPAELLSAADELRLLGNDAAHIESKNYDEVGEHEAELAIELAKEILKAVYQYVSLVSRLKALRK